MQGYSFRLFRRTWRYFLFWLFVFGVVFAQRVAVLESIEELPEGLMPEPWVVARLIIVFALVASMGSLISYRLTNNRAVLQKPFAYVMLIKLGIHFISLLVLITIGYQAFRQLGLQLGAGGEPVNLGDFLRTTGAALNLFYVSVMNFGLITFELLASKLGDRRLRSYLRGRYHEPKAERLIFMFLDLKSSTKAAEQLGNLRYSRMIQQCFLDVTDSLELHQGIIYQYVGDEIVICWPIEDGLRRLNCINTFYHFREQLIRRAAYYEREFGWLPQFKAGMHAGEVIAVEVGYQKREIAYHGDAINTAARIQGHCNPLGAELLISDELAGLMREQANEKYVLQSVGKQRLKGKECEVGLVKVSPKA